MKTACHLLCLLGLAAAAPSCVSKGKPPVPAAPTASLARSPAAKSSESQTTPAEDEEFDEYAGAEVADPWEGFNRATFRFNDGLYTVLLRPLAKGYTTVLPEPARKGITNACTNVRYPVRLVNSALQGKFKRAGKETAMFAVNTVAGIGGLFRVSDKIPSLADVPPEDTGQTFAVWGMGHGPYLVLPFLGPCTVRETVGLAGDYVLNPVHWGIFWNDGGDWKMIPPAVNTLQLLPEQLALYDSSTENAVDPYLSARSFYIQNRAHAAQR